MRLQFFLSSYGRKVLNHFANLDTLTFVNRDWFNEGLGLEKVKGTVVGINMRVEISAVLVFQKCRVQTV